MLECQQEQQRPVVVAILSSFLVPSLCHASCATLGCCAPPFILHERQVSRSEKTSQVRQDWGSGHESMWGKRLHKPVSNKCRLCELNTPSDK